MTLPPTIYDIAKRAGVGIATVSRVLNGSDRVADATRTAVQLAMKELDFRPNRAARRLAVGGVNRPRVAALMPFFSASFYYAVSAPLSAALSAADIDLVLYNIQDRDHKNRVLDRIVAERACEGLVLLSMGVRPARLAVTGPDVATRISGAISGIVHSRVDSRVKCAPLCFVSRPATDAVNSFLMISIASNMRLIRSAVSGQ